MKRFIGLAVIVLAVPPGTLAQMVIPTTQPQAPVQIQVPAPGAAPTPAQQPAAEPAPFDPNSVDGAQSYREIYTRQEEKPKPKLPRYTGTIGDFDRNAVMFNIQGRWYRMPRSLFGADVRSGDKASIRMTPEQLRAYRVRK